MEKRLTLTYRTGSAMSRPAMAKWIMDHDMPNQYAPLTSREALDLIDTLVAGKPLVLETASYVHECTPYEACPFLGCVTEFVEDEYDQEYRERQEELDIADDLRKRGAAGDAEAAIEFCKMNHLRLYAAYAGAG